ncbi:MAG: tRNA (guanosine(37)-N1)-methyltransferase TrmD [Dehalococcoidia bacterium]
MKFHVLTLFTEAFAGPVEHSMLGRASQRGIISVELTDIRDYAHDPHSSADDYQFGGGHGMVMKPEPIFEAVEAVLAPYPEAERATIPIILLSPQGRVLDQELVYELARHETLVLICGHYAGVDERVRTHLITDEVSIGDYVLTGGELAAIVLIDAVSRFTPGVVGSQENVLEDSITSGLLQHPLYTRPAEFRGIGTPEILLSGHHAQIEQWRRRKSLRRTWERRPDLLETAELTPQDLEYLQSLGYQKNPDAPDLQ